MQQGDPVYFQDANVFVSRSRISLNGALYPVQAVSSVRAVIDKKTAFFSAAGGLLIFGGLAGTVSAIGSHDSQSGMVAAFAVVMGAICLFIHYRMRDRYVLILGQMGAEKHALVSEDATYINAVVAAINQAIINR